MKVKNNSQSNINLSDDTQKFDPQNGEVFFPSQEEIKEESLRIKSLLHRFNNIDPAKIDRKKFMLKGILPNCGEGLTITSPFHCSRGYNITAGKNFYCNVGCVILDLAQVVIGDDVQIGPQVNIYTVSHPIDPVLRSTGIEYAKPITIGNRVWIGGKSVILPGVTIGNDVVIAAGSVVNHDIPDSVVVGGVPAKILKHINNQ